LTDFTLDKSLKNSDAANRSRRAGGSADLADIVARLDQLELDNVDLRADNESLRADNIELSANVEQLRADNESLRADNQALSRSNSELKSANAKLATANFKLEKANAKLEQLNRKLDAKLDETKAEVAKLKDELNRDRRLIPSSEKGSADSGDGSRDGGGNGSGQGGDDDDTNKNPSPSAKEEYEELCRNKDPNLDFIKSAKAKGLTLHGFWLSHNSDSRFLQPTENLMSSGSAEVIYGEKKMQFSDDEKKQHFGKTKGLHSSFDETTNYNLRLIIEKMKVSHETLRDESQSQRFDRALTLRKRDELVIPNSQITSQSLITLISLHCEYKIPMRRLEKVLHLRIFSADNMSRWLTQAANHFLPIYLYLPDLLGQKCNFLFTDDTNTHVLALSSKARSGQLKPDRSLSEEELKRFFQGTAEYAYRQHKPDILTEIAKRLGRVSAYVDGKTPKTKINMTLVCGKSDESDWRSMICFFRTHCGQAGNLISRIYEPFLDQSANRKLYVQGDSSGQNHVEKSVKARIAVHYPGCSDHARRPFKRFAEEDENLAYAILIRFLHLYNLEREIKCGALVEDRILTIRARGLAYWDFLREISLTVVDGKVDSVIKNRVHKPHSNLFKGCKYILNNFESLTMYLTHARLAQTNGISERKLRPEKMFIDSSKFSASEIGSATKDILQTMIATTIASGQEPAKYFQWALAQDAAAIEADPAQYTPFKFACCQTENARPQVVEKSKIDIIDPAAAYFH